MSAISAISRVKKPIGTFPCMAIFAAIVRAKAVLPTEGLAPITINSDF